MMPHRHEKPQVKNITLNPDFFPTKSRMQNFSGTLRALALPIDMFLLMFALSKKLSRSLFDLIVVARYGAPYVYKNIIALHKRMGQCHPNH